MRFKLPLVFTYGAVFAAHAGFGGAAPDAFQAAVAVTVFPGGCLKATVAIAALAAVDAMIFIGIVLMKPAGAFGTTGSKGRSAAKSTFSSH